MHHLAHHWAAFVAIGIGVFTAIAMGLLAAFHHKADPDA